MSRRKADRPKMILFTAPSGAGKTTVVHHLLDKFPFLGFSISATTRNKRKKEEEGLDYYFLDHKSFKEKIYSGEFVEWEEVYDNQYYGTLKSEIERNHQAKKVVVFDIEVKGATKIKEYYGDDCMAVFIRPPSLQILIERLKNRKSEDSDSLRKRVARAREELSYEKNFDCVLVNDLLEVALLEAEVIVKDFLDIEWDGNTND